MTPKGNQYAIAALKDRRAELARDIGIHETAASRLRVELDHLDATIRLFDPKADISAIKPKAIPPFMGAQRGANAHAVFALLRTAGRPCTTREITLHVMASRGLDTADTGLVTLMGRRVSTALRHYRQLKVLQSSKAFGENVKWQIADASET